MALNPNIRSRMFHVGGKPMKTWNCFIGCSFDCTYCNAKKTALTRLKHSPRYGKGFVPHEIESDLERSFSPGDFVFIAYMGDISFASFSFIAKIMHRVAAQPEVNFLVCTKNPAAYRVWPRPFPANLVLGATIESTYDLELSKAPSPYERYQYMLYIPHPRKFVSIEPICDFDPPEMLRWMRALQPEIIEVGADNYNNHLQEPSWFRVEILLNGLKEICSNVVEKVGLHRLENK
jgi:hypothetical protein